MPGSSRCLAGPWRRWSAEAAPTPFGPVSATVDVCLPGLPDCWESCGNCSDGELSVVEVLVAPGDQVSVNTPVLVLETDKTTLDIQADRAGRVVEVAVAVGDRVGEGQLLLRVAPEVAP